MSPIRLFPSLSQRPWGVQSLRPWVAAEAGAEPIGEAWFTDNRTMTSAGVSLGGLIAANRNIVLGPMVHNELRMNNDSDAPLEEK